MRMVRGDTRLDQLTMKDANKRANCAVEKQPKQQESEPWLEPGSFTIDKQLDVPEIDQIIVRAEHKLQ